ncbi:MAG: EAL domain-containing protein [Clostridiales bacterium]|nr:EAL domain-containing protein [Clostridiales bacterium]
MSNKIFKIMVIVCGFNLIFDMSTVVSLHYYDIVPAWINRLLHQFFIGSLDLFIALFCLFVITLVHDIRYHLKRHILCFVPFVISIIVVIFGDLQYYIDDKARYSYGTVVFTIYISVALYLLITLINLFRYRKILKRKTRLLILAAISGEAIAACIQLYNPNLLASSLAMVLMLTFTFYTMVNPSEYIEKETEILNRYAFITMLNEKFGSKKEFYVLNVSFDDWGVLNTRFGQDFSFRVMSVMAQFMETTFHTNVYRSRTKCLSMLIDEDKDRIREIARHIFIKLEDSIKIDQVDVVLKPHLLAIKCPEYAKKQEDIFNILEMLIYKGFAEKDQEKKLIFYDKNMQAKLERYITIERMLKDAVEKDGFDVVYQPIYSRKDQRINSCEALVRLKDTQTIGFVSPEEFITIAERMGVIVELGRIVFKKVCEFAKSHSLMEKGIEYIEVNLSAIQYLDPNLADSLVEIMRIYKLPGTFFNFEITESAAVDKNIVIQTNIKRLHNAGCTFSMDDYGTGYSNLSMMIDMPYHIIKLDKSLIWPCYPPLNKTSSQNEYQDSKKSHVVLESSVRMVKNLDYKIVAEGIETQEQLDAMLEMGVDYIQGYYFSKPVDGETFYQKIDEWNKIIK